LARILFDAAVKRWGSKWGVRGIADPAGLPLLALIFSTLFFVATPFINTVTRITEREADAFGINAAREPDGMAEVALKLGAYRKLDPTPLEEIIFFDHPSGRARIRMAMYWKAANLPAGESLAGEIYSQQTWHQLIYSSGVINKTEALICICTHCRLPSYWVGDQLVFPASAPVEPAHPDLPDQCKLDYEEASAVFVHSPRASAALIRLAIQKAYGRGRPIRQEYQR